MTTIPADDGGSGNPFGELAVEASATLRELLAAEGLAEETPHVLPAFERAIRATIAAVATGLPADLPRELTRDFALAYLTGRIAKAQALALQQARALIADERARAEQHWQAALDAERRRVARESPSLAPAAPLAADESPDATPSR